nr:hypothetical protein [Tanacetum cinerariifolium]
MLPVFRSIRFTTPLTPLPPTSHHLGSSHHATHHHPLPNTTPLLPSPHHCRHAPPRHQPPPHCHAATPPPLYHGNSRCLSTTVTTTNATTTAATTAAFPAAAVAGCGWQIGYHRYGGAYKSPRSPLNMGCLPPNHHCGGGRTTVQPPQPQLVVLGCDGATPSEASGGQPPKTTTVVAAEPTTATTAAPWWCRACGGLSSKVGVFVFRFSCIDLYQSGVCVALDEAVTPPSPSGELDGTPTLSDGRDTTKTVKTNLSPSATTTSGHPLPPPEKFSGELFRRTPKMLPVSRSIRFTTPLTPLPPTSHHLGSSHHATHHHPPPNTTPPLPSPHHCLHAPPRHQPHPHRHAATPPPLHHGSSRCLSTTVTTTNATTTAATATAFPAVADAAAVAGCGWQIGYHRHGGAYNPPDLVGCPPPNHHRGGGRTTVQPPQPHLVASGCDGATPSEALGWSAA